jgi:glutaminyl-tRNA synthetase
LSTSSIAPRLANAALGSVYQFERLGYFCVDAEDSTDKGLVFNRTVTFRYSWKKMDKKTWLNKEDMHDGVQRQHGATKK